MLRNQVEKYEIDELVIGLTGGLDRVLGNDVPVLVTFDYDAGSADGEDLPSLHNVVVRCAGETTLGDEDAELKLACGFNLNPYITDAQTDKIEETILARIAEREKEEA